MFFMSPKKIIELCNRWLTGKVTKTDRLKVAGFSMDETFYFWTMYGIGSSKINGVISKETARKEQLRVHNIFSGMAKELYFTRKIRNEGSAARNTYIAAIADVFRHLDKREAEPFILSLVEALCALMGHRPLFTLTTKALEDENFKSACINAFIKNADYFEEKFNGEIALHSYLPLLEKFFAGCVKDGSAELFNGFGDEAEEVFLDTDGGDLRRFAENSQLLYGLKEFPVESTEKESTPCLSEER